MLSLPTALVACGGGGGHGGSDPVTVVVTSLADSGPGSLRQEVFDAPPGATVAFHPTLTGGTVTLLSQIAIGKPIQIDGGDPGNPVTIDGNNATRLFEFEDADGVVLKNLILRRGNTAGDGGIIAAVAGTLRLERVSLLDGFAVGYGGGLFASYADVEMVGCHVQGCIGSVGGGLYIGAGDSRVVDSSVISNAATDGIGGGMAVWSGTHVARSSTFSSNIATGFGPGPFHGGAIAATSAQLYGAIHLGLYGCTIADNDADDSGGGVSIWPQNTGGTFECRQCVIAGNSATSDPDVWVEWTGPAPTVTSAWNVIGILAGGPIWNGLGGNLVGDPVTPINPSLGPITGSGTETRTLPLLAVSVAIDRVPHAECLAEDGLPLAVDQRGASRTADAAADVGAVERP